MKKIICTFSVVFAICFTYLQTFAQSSYKTAVGLGVDFGYGTVVGPSVKYFFNSNNAVQGDILFGYGLTFIGAYYQYHRSFKELKELKWYAGLGPQLAFDDRGAAIFLRPMVGLDYKIKHAPLSLTLDWRPTILIDKGSGFGAASFGLGVRYAYR